MTSEKKQLPLFLNKIYSDKKAFEILDILDAIRPTHNERIWMVSFLRYVGYSYDEVLDIIREEATWADFDEKTTAYQVGTLFGRRPQRTQNHQTRQVRKWALSELEILRIRRQHSISLSKLLCEEHPMEFPHPERLVSSEFNPTAEFLRK